MTIVFAARESLWLQLKYGQGMERPAGIYSATSKQHLDFGIGKSTTHRLNFFTTQRPSHPHRHRVGAQAGCGAGGEDVEVGHSLCSR